MKNLISQHVGYTSESKVSEVSAANHNGKELRLAQQ